MYPSNNMNSFPFSHIPTIWFISRRENLETYHEELSTLRDKVTRFTGSQNIIAVLEAAEAVNQLTEQIQCMEEMFESKLSPYIKEYDSYNKNNLRRIKELASGIASNLETIARQISWGLPYDKQVGQVRRNLFPLIELLEIVLKWLEKASD